MRGEPPLDVLRTNALREQYRGKVFGEQLEPHWIDGGLWWRHETGRDTHRFRTATFDQPTPRDLFDHDALAAALGHSVLADELPIENVSLTPDGRTLHFDAFDSTWTTDRDFIAIQQIEPEAQADEPRRGAREQNHDSAQAKSPDGRWGVTLRDHNVFLADGDATPRQLTYDGTPQDSYGGRVHWSPDSSKFVVLQTRDGHSREVTVVQSAPGNQLQPKVITYDYRKAGDDIPQSRPRLFDVERGRVEVDESLWPNPWSLRNVRWRGDSSGFTVEYNQRGHLVLRVIAVDAETGEVKAIVEEARDTHIAWKDKYHLHWINDDRLVWMSERDGWNHLYLYDLTGDSIKQLTSGEWAVREVVANNNEKELLWLETYGRDGVDGDGGGREPLYRHLAKVDFDGNLTWLTDADGTHERPNFMPNADWSHYVVTWSRVDQPPVHELRRSSDGKLLTTLGEADATGLYAAGWQPPEQFAAPGRDVELMVHGVLFRPTNFEPEKRYPIIEDIYMGLPIAPKRWRVWDGRRALAELGFVVVVNDPAVTVWPSRRHWDIGYKNLGDAGFPDRIAWIKAAAKQRPWMDLDRVGIYGTSAGGQASLRGMLAHPEFYKVCVSSCGCHDNRMDKIWWNEYWMGWPVGPHYAEQSNVTNAHRLQGDLLLIVGEIDQNVDPASTMQVVDALVQADKDFELLVLPNAGHTSGGRYGERKRREFFVRHLLGPSDRSTADQ